MAMVERGVMRLHHPILLELDGSEDADVLLCFPTISNGDITLPLASTHLQYMIRNLSTTGKRLNINAQADEKIEGTANQTLFLGPNRLLVLQASDEDGDPGWFIVGGDFSQGDPNFSQTAYRQGGYIGSSG